MSKEDAARSIFGEDFIPAGKIAQVRGLAYTDGQLIELRSKLPGQATLEQLRRDDMMLVASPPVAMSMIDVRMLKADYFYYRGPTEKEPAWYDSLRVRFARVDHVTVGWVALCKEPLQGSLAKSWWEQMDMVRGTNLIVPSAAEVAWALTTYKAVNDVYLLSGLHVRTSSIDDRAEDRHVYVGCFDEYGLVVSHHEDGDRDQILGIAVGRNF